MKKQRVALTLTTIVLLGVASACSVTTAPTEESTRTFGKTSEASTDMSSSTSPGSSGNTSATVREFTRVNYASIKQEMASGEGEHLDALAALLQVSEPEIPRFCALTQEHYHRLYPSANTSPEQMLKTLQLTLATESTRIQ